MTNEVQRTARIGKRTTESAREELTQEFASWIDSEMRRIAKTKSDAGALARAVIRLRSVGAPGDEIDVAGRPLLNAFMKIMGGDRLEAPIKIADPIWRRRRGRK